VWAAASAQLVNCPQSLLKSVPACPIYSIRRSPPPALACGTLEHDQSATRGRRRNRGWRLCLVLGLNAGDKRSRSSFESAKAVGVAVAGVCRLPSRGRWHMGAVWTLGQDVQNGNRLVSHHDTKIERARKLWGCMHCTRVAFGRVITRERRRERRAEGRGRAAGESPPGPGSLARLCLSYPPRSPNPALFESRESTRVDACAHELAPVQTTQSRNWCPRGGQGSDGPTLAESRSRLFFIEVLQVVWHHKRAHAILELYALAGTSLSGGELSRGHRPSAGHHRLPRNAADERELN
jgi:hypothetical protein